jgi:hypothetical protein
MMNNLWYIQGLGEGCERKSEKVTSDKGEMKASSTGSEVGMGKRQGETKGEQERVQQV